MLKQRIAAAEAVRDALRPAEASIDLAAREAHRVVTTMMDQRKRIGLDGSVGGHPLHLASRAAILVLEAQNLMHEAHAALAPVAASLGLAGRERMYGCEDPPEHDGPGQAFVRVLFGEDASDAPTMVDAST